MNCPICHQHKGTEEAVTLLGEEIVICKECAAAGGFESNGEMLIIVDEDAYYERWSLFNEEEE